MSDIQNVKTFLLSIHVKEEKNPAELTTELLCKANVYFHIIKICLFYCSHYQTNRGVGNLGEKRYGSLFLLA